MNPSFRAFRIRNDEKGYRAGIEEMQADALSPGEILVKVAYSSVNYKDALAGTGKGRILRTFPLNGGIDLAGYVAESRDPAFKEGDAVLCTGCGCRKRGTAAMRSTHASNRMGDRLAGRIEPARVDDHRYCGFTAALALFRMQQNGQTPEMGPIVVSGASGGVGMLAINLLSRAGYTAHAITGKTDQFDFLIELGAQQCIGRNKLHWGQRPLETAHWAGAIDNVGGDMLAGLSRVIQPYGNIAICGNAGGIELATTVMPFILRGVSLLGIASAGTARVVRDALWQHLADDWKPTHLDKIATKEVIFDDLPTVFAQMLAGGSFGRTLVRVS